MFRRYCLVVALSAAVGTLSAGANAQGLPFVPNDPLFAQQWHLAKQSTGALIDVNVLGAWTQGWTGQGVNIGIVEQGSFQSDHPDLAPNWAPEFDLSPWAADDHATGTAGIAAGRGGNGIGGTGAAPFASLSSLHVDYPEATTDQSQAYAARYRNDAIDIKSWSLSWIGSQYLWSSHPFYGQGILDSEAAGVINVRAAANSNHDANNFPDKNFFGQIVVGGVGSNGTRYEHTGFGAGITVVAPTQRAAGELAITTTSPGNSYVNDYGGTSASTPLVAGILALAKEAQPALDTRMSKHLLARTSRVVDPENPRRLHYPEFETRLLDHSNSLPLGKWRTNAAGIHFSNDYGFGLIDATALVSAAQEFTGVTPLVTASTGAVAVGEVIPEDSFLSKSFTVTQLGKVEDIRFDYSITGLFKSSIQMSLTSPSGTVGLIHSPWVSADGAGVPGTRTWSMMTNAFWGEDVDGEWTVTLRDLPWNQVGEMADQVLWDSFGITTRIGDLIPASTGDFNADGSVDGNDFLLWQRTFGSTLNLAADDSGNGVVDVEDLDLWRANFGASASPLAAQIPEPRSVTLMLLTASALFTMRRSR